MTAIAASLVKELRERTGAGMMECKKALIDADGAIDAAQELLRTRGQAKADKKAGRIAAEGQIMTAASPAGDVTAIMEVNCETDFVAKADNFQDFARQAVELAAVRQPADVDALMALPATDGRTLEEARRDLVAKIGENIGVRRFAYLRPVGQLASYFHGTRIGVLVDVVGGDADLGKDLAMHIAASNPRYLSVDEVPEDIRANERRILSEQAQAEGKPAEIVAKMVEGRLRKYLNEIVLLGQSFVKDPDLSIEKLLKQRGAKVQAFVRLEVGEGIEKKSENIAEAVAAMNSGG
ncbi:MAG: elongation factor Ts [Gammaproteobacteria bacterium]|jgi:elongation factor Ts|nr:elongation factor Ts [Gammaproteobacteria bacterium]